MGVQPVAATAQRLRTYRVVLEWDDEDPSDPGWVATVPALPGCVTQGSTVTEVMQRVQEAILGYLEVLAKRGEPIPPPDADSPAVAVPEPLA